MMLFQAALKLVVVLIVYVHELVTSRSVVCCTLSYCKVDSVQLPPTTYCYCHSHCRTIGSFGCKVSAVAVCSARVSLVVRVTSTKLTRAVLHHAIAFTCYCIRSRLSQAHHPRSCVLSTQAAASTLALRRHQQQQQHLQ
jgi:hypothetical protein